MQPKNSCTALRCRVCVADTKLSHARNVECGSFCRKLSQQLRPRAAATKTTAGILSLFTNSCGEPSALVGSRLWRRVSRDSFFAECDSSSSTCLPPCSLARAVQPTPQPASTSVWQGRLSVGAVSEGSKLSSSLPIAAYQKCQSRYYWASLPFSPASFLSLFFLCLLLLLALLGLCLCLLSLLLWPNPFCMSFTVITA